ncbi:MAG: hypothetical protein LC649_10270 [Bacteroidales bacterium]|nr:hypothetical protein [Bacteroidales bacterium]
MKILSKIWWLPLTVWIMVAPVIMSGHISSTFCRKVEVMVADSSLYRFVTPAAVLDIVRSGGREVAGKPCGEIDIRGIEKEILEMKELEKADVFVTGDGILRVEVDQRDPVARIITRYGVSYYTDRNGVVVPHTGSYTPRVTVVSGYLEIPDSITGGGSLRDAGEESLLANILDMVNYINGDKFWKAQIEQIWINPQQELEIVPMAGNHIIRFGKAEDYLVRFACLEEFYRSALPLVGWNSYSEIDLRFKGQIVCTRR